MATMNASTNNKPDASNPANGETNEEPKKPTVQEFIESFSLYRLIDPNEPWVLVEEGSFLGYFDWVPRPLRVGPWSVAAICYLFAIPYATAVALLHYSKDPWASIHENHEILQYPGIGSPEWTYNFVAFLWMIYVNYLIIIGPLSYKAWSTYTVQSWTLLWIRHGLCILAPFNSWALRWAEYTRFPVACSATIVFFVWNFALMPFVYFIGMKTAEKKKNFLKFCFSFRLVQLHGLNIVYCFLNVLWASPNRSLETLDLLAAIGSVLVYMGWYLCCLDRVGVHLYPIFSPRLNWLVISTWTTLLLVYMGTFYAWQRMLHMVG